MAGIHTPFAAHHSNLDGASSREQQQAPNTAGRQMSNGLMLDDSFNLPSCPSLDDFLMHATQGFMDSAAAAAAAQGGRPGSGAIATFPSRLLTLSTGKSLSGMASLDLSWLGDGPFGAQQAQHGGPFSRAHSMQRKPSLAEQLVGPEQLGSKELPSVLPLNIDNGLVRPVSASGSLPTDKNINNNNTHLAAPRPASAPNASISPTPTPPSSPSYALPGAAEAAFPQLHAAHASLLEAQTAYLKILESTNNDPSLKTATPSLATAKQYEQIAAAQQHLAMQQSYFAAALMHAQQFQQQQQIACGLPPTDITNFATAVPMPGFPNQHQQQHMNNPYSTGFPPSTGGLIPLGSNGVPSSSSCFAPHTPSQTRASAMAQWEQERALMQALNSSDMETAVQAFSGILSVAGGGAGDMNFAGPCGVPQNLPVNPSASHFDHNTMYGSSSSPSMSNGMFTTGGSNDNSRAPTPPLSMTVKISNGMQPMVCVTHAQPIKVSCSSPPSSPMRVEHHQ